MHATIKPPVTAADIPAEWYDMVREIIRREGRAMRPHATQPMVEIKIAHHEPLGRTHVAWKRDGVRERDRAGSGDAGIAVNERISPMTDDDQRLYVRPLERENADLRSEIKEYREAIESIVFIAASHPHLWNPKMQRAYFLTQKAKS